MRIDHLERLAARSDFDTLAEIELSSEKFAARANVDSLYSCASNVFRCYRRLLEMDLVQIPQLPRDSNQWSWLALILGSYYSQLVNLQHVKGLPEGKVLPPGINVPAMESLAAAVDDELRPLLPERHSASSIMHAFVGITLFLHLVDGRQAHPSESAGSFQPFQVIEAMAHGWLLRLYREARVAPDRSLRLLADRYLHDFLVQLDEHYENQADRYWDPDVRLGVFSLLDLQALSGVAARDTRMVNRYGRSLPKVFEQQLALLAQSFGFIVVQTRTGERTVDLLCISRDPSASYSFLMEAKTTAGRYALPTKDERALRDYVADVRSILTTLPPLRLVVIVGPPCAKTVDSKVRMLESDVGIPVRYCPVAEMSALRQSLPGPVPARIFLEEFQSAPHVVSRGSMAGAVTRVQAEQEAHSAFVESLLRGSTKQSGRSHRAAADTEQDS